MQVTQTQLLMMPRLLSLLWIFVEFVTGAEIQQQKEDVYVVSSDCARDDRGPVGSQLLSHNSSQPLNKCTV